MVQRNDSFALQRIQQTEVTLLERPVSLLALSPSSGSAGAPASDRPNPPLSSLFAQSAGQILSHDFPSGAISFLLLDARTGRVLAFRWDNPQAPSPLASLVKPFTALA